MFEDGHYLLVVDDPVDECSNLYLSHTLTNQSRQFSLKKRLPYSRVGKKFLCTVDESKRLLAIVTAADTEVS